MIFADCFVKYDIEQISSTWSVSNAFANTFAQHPPPPALPLSIATIELY